MNKCKLEFSLDLTLAKEVMINDKDLEDLDETADELTQKCVSFIMGLLKDWNFEIYSAERHDEELVEE